MRLFCHVYQPPAALLRRFFAEALGGHPFFGGARLFDVLRQKICTIHKRYRLWSGQLVLFARLHMANSLCYNELTMRSAGSMVSPIAAAHPFLCDG